MKLKNEEIEDLFNQADYLGLEGKEVYGFTEATCDIKHRDGQYCEYDLSLTHKDGSKYSILVAFVDQMNAGYYFEFTGDEQELYEENK